MHEPVFNGTTRATYVARRSASTWFVGGPDFIDDDASQFRRVPLDTLCEVDPSLEEFAILPIGHCASRTSPYGVWTHGLVPVGNMFFVNWDLRPSESNSRRNEVAGAIASCWIVAESLSEALRITRERLADSEWVVVDRLDAKPALRQDFEESSYFRQAEVDGMVVLFHTYPHGDAVPN